MIIIHLLSFFTEAIDGPAWRYFSAVCWMYGRRLYEQYRVPIGLIASYWGGTCIEAWSSPDALRKCGLERSGENKNKRVVARSVEEVET